MHPGRQLAGRYARQVPAAAMTTLPIILIARSSTQLTREIFLAQTRVSVPQRQAQCGTDTLVCAWNSLPLANVFAEIRALGPALRLRDLGVLRAAHLDRFAMPSDHGQAIVARERRGVVGAQDCFVVGDPFVGAAAGVVIHLVDLRRAS